MLNEHADICIGCERYIYRYKECTVRPKDFMPERYSTLLDGDTFYASLNEMEGWLSNEGKPQGVQKIQHASIIGDKAPYLIYEIRTVAPFFPDSTVWVVTVRDILSVARSWIARAEDPSDTLWSANSKLDDAIVHWSSSLCAFLDLRESSAQAIDVFMPHLYREDMLEINRLLRYLSVHADQNMSNYISGSVEWQSLNPGAVHTSPKTPSVNEREAIMSNDYIATAVRKCISSSYRVPLDELFWSGFREQYLDRAA